MMWGYYDGWNWFWMGGIVLMFGVGVIAVVIWAARTFSGPGRPGDPAIETLRRRLASGEISPEDFDKTRRILLG